MIAILICLLILIPIHSMDMQYGLYQKPLKQDILDRTRSALMENRLEDAFYLMHLDSSADWSIFATVCDCVYHEA